MNGPGQSILLLLLEEPLVRAITSGASLLPWKLSVLLGELCPSPQHPASTSLQRFQRPGQTLPRHSTSPSMWAIALLETYPPPPTAPCLPSTGTSWHHSLDVCLLQCFLLLPRWLPAREGRKRHEPLRAVPLLSKHSSWSWDRVCGAAASRSPPLLQAVPLLRDSLAAGTMVP